MIKKKSIKWGWILLAIFLLQVIYFWIPSKKLQANSTARELELSDFDNSEFLNNMMLEDSLSLARPSRRGFSGAWLIPVTNEHKLSRWVLPDVLPPKETNLFGKIIDQVLSRNTAPESRVFKRVEPELTRVVVPSLQAYDETRLVVSSGLRSRLKLKQVELKSSWQLNNFLEPSRVQILVDPEGMVLSGVLLESSGYQPADQAAMDFALRQVAFKKSTNSILESGDLIFHWHIDPNSITNILESSP